MSIQQPDVLQALSAVIDPNTGKDFVSTRQLKNLQVDANGDVAFDVELGYPAKSQIPALRQALVAAARGVALLSAQQAGLPLYEYTPMQIKSAVTGNGHADKKQVQQMIKLLLSLNSIPKPDDAADALAAALCHANTSGPAAETFRIK